MLACRLCGFSGLDHPNDEDLSLGTPASETWGTLICGWDGERQKGEPFTQNVKNGTLIFAYLDVGDSPIKRDERGGCDGNDGELRAGCRSTS